jgi:hypothetical protein
MVNEDPEIQAQIGQRFSRVLETLEVNGRARPGSEFLVFPNVELYVLATRS